MRKSILALTSIAAMFAATPAVAQDEDTSGITVVGGAAVVSDYRFRGVSQSTEDFAIQGTFTINHESGLYVGTWGSSIGFAGGTEIDFYAGYAKEVIPGLTLDGGVTYYWYPSGVGPTDVIEPYISVTGMVGPVKAKAGLAYAPDQKSLGSESAIYTYVDLSSAIPNTPFTLKSHVGFAKSDSALGGADGDLVDYSVGVDATWKALTFGISYVNTDHVKTLGVKPAGTDGTVVFSLSAAF